MSLFGGEPATLRWPSESSSHSSSPHEEAHSLSPEAQRVPSVSPVPQLPDDTVENPDATQANRKDSDEDSAESEYEPSDGSSVASRPNQFQGLPQIWRRYTAKDRQIAASLEQISAGDLSSHLYNTHALKRQARLAEQEIKSMELKDWQSKEKWLKKDDDLLFTGPNGDIQKELVPWKRWSAWPLEELDVPGPEERFGRTPRLESDEKWTVGQLDEQDVGLNLRDEILGVCLRLAKKKWQGRQWADEADEGDRADSKADAEFSNAEGRPESHRRRLRSRSKSVKSNRSSSRNASSRPSDTEMDDRSNEGTDTETFSDVPSTKMKDSLHRNRWFSRLGEPVSALSEPVVLADDDEARRILQPNINSLMAKLDSLLDAIQRTRRNHFAGKDDSGSEATSDTASTSSRRLSRSRSASKTQKHPSQPRNSLSRASSQTSIEPHDQPPKRKPKHQPTKPSTSATASDQNYTSSHEPQSATSNTDTRPRASHPKKSSSRTASQSRTSSPLSQTSDASYRAGLMDWSEVLSLASMTNWDAGVVSRAAKRCAALFDESMAFRTLDAGTVSGPGEVVRYTPSMIYAVDSGAEDMEGEGNGDAGIEHEGEREEDRPVWEVGSLYCPHEDCFGHERGFPKAWRVVEHIQRVHGYDPRVAGGEKEEEMLGGVHVDGFLQPVRKRHGWRGGDRDSESASRNRSSSRKGRGKRKRDGEREVEGVAESM